MQHRRISEEEILKFYQREIFVIVLRISTESVQDPIYQ